MLPGIVLTIFLALLPTILSLLNKKVQKMTSETDVEFGVVRKYFAFQVWRYMQLLSVAPSKSVVLLAVYVQHKWILMSDMCPLHAH